MDNYIKLEIALKDDSMAPILIAQLSEYGFEGFEERPHLLDAFIPEKQFQETETLGIIRGHGLTCTRTSIAPKNWNLEWEKNFEPVTVEDFCAIRASFHPPMDGFKHEIIITPKMSFGTGHHATTWLMVKALQKINCINKKVLDFGTGTGLLAILAEKSGAQEVLAIDNDSWSIENSLENIARNNCSRILVQHLDSLAGTGRFDIILANINKHVIMKNLAFFQQHLLPDGVLAISGILSSDLTDIEKEAVSHNLKISIKMEMDSWACLILKVIN